MRWSLNELYSSFDSSDISNISNKLSTYATLTSNVDAKNDEALLYLNKLSVMSTELTKQNVVFQRFLKNIESSYNFKIRKVIE